MKKQRVFIDLDNVACDFMKSYLETKRTDPRREFPHSKTGFFSEMQPLEGFLEAYHTLENFYDLWFLTRPSIKNLHCYTEKAVWVRNHIGEEALERLVLACDKSIVKGDFLIDDDTRFGQTEFEGEHIHFGSDARFETWPQVTAYLLTDEVRQRRSTINRYPAEI